MNFLAELKRRNVIRMAGLYLVGAWLIVQVAATLLPVFEAPGWVMKTLVALLVIGFIPALIISWVFELTPDGLRREDEIASAEPSGRALRHRQSARCVFLSRPARWPHGKNLPARAVSVFGITATPPSRLPRALCRMQFSDSILRHSKLKAPIIDIDAIIVIRS
jgi:hypothetical protein